MEFEDNIYSVEIIAKLVQVVTGQGVGIYGGGGFRFLTPAQRDHVNDLAAWGMDEIVFDPIV